jgi:Fic family protein
MSEFLNWFNRSLIESKSPLSESPIRAGIAHFYFQSTHPFEDGSGRMGRAISDKALAQGAGRFAVSASPISWKRSRLHFS